MPEFISKLQYKTSEKGEYSDEKARSLEETIELVKSFPWAREQYADVSVTGPSITIQDYNGNFLKAGIYFGGRHSLYYMDNKHRYYVLMNVTIDVVFGKVNDFFKGQIDLQSFEKARFSFGAKGYFATNKFEYRTEFWYGMLLMIVWAVFFLMFFIPAVLSQVLQPLNPLGFFLLGIDVLFGWPLVCFFKKYYQRNQYLRISRGNDVFLFGEDQASVTSFNKNDIIEIIHCVDSGSRSPNMLEIIEIVFKDHTSIKFSNILISYSTLATKLSDKWKFPTTTISKNSFRIMASLP
jgi:hypothetical protein